MKLLLIKTILVGDTSYFYLRVVVFVYLKTFSYPRCTVLFSFTSVCLSLHNEYTENVFCREKAISLIS